MAPTMDFDPEEPLVFPQPVELLKTSREFMDSIRAYPLEPSQTALWHLGQNSWILKGTDGTLVAIDPYLTDYCASKRTRERVAKSRLLPVFIEPEDLAVDLVILTHSHPDHADPYTLERLTIKQSALFLAPWQVLPVLEAAGIPLGRQQLMHPLQTYRSGTVEVTGTFAEPTDFTDLNHMGFVIRIAGGAVYYNSGDTAKSELLEHVKAFAPKVMSLCINGGYHNLNFWEAAEICALIQPQIAVPAHYDMMPHNLQPPHMFRKALYEKARSVEYQRLAYYQPLVF